MLQLTTLTLSELAQHAGRWDDLWQRSEVRFPTKRAGGIQLWCQSFAPEAELTAIVVLENDRFVAGLPLIKDPARWALQAYRLPSNCMVGSGDFLLDPDCDIDGATQLLACHIGQLSGTIATFEGIEIHSDRWQRLISALRDAGRELHLSRGHDVGVVDILHDWNAYTRSWSRNHRSSIRRSRKKLEAAGKVEFQRLREVSDNELYDALETCYAIEDKGWKGENGTSILRTPGLGSYYHEEARMMRDAGMLDLWLLKLNDQVIAFEYCHYCKATCLSHKISFDPQFDRFSPGRALQGIQLEQYHQDPSAELLDTLGVMCEAKAKWVTRTYKSSTLFVAIGSHGSNMLLRALVLARRLAKRLRPAETDVPKIKPGAERYLQTATSSTASTSRVSSEKAATTPAIACPPPTPAPQQSPS